MIGSPSDPDLVAKLKEADRQAEVRRQEWDAQQERRRREEDRRLVEQSIVDSKTELQQVIQRWSDVMSIEGFLTGVEQTAKDLPEAERRHVLERLALARGFIGTQNPFDFFRGWKAPEERYTSRYAGAEPSAEKE